MGFSGWLPHETCFRIQAGKLCRGILSVAHGREPEPLHMSGTWWQTQMVLITLNHLPQASRHRQPLRPLVVFMEVAFSTLAGGTRNEHLEYLVDVADHIKNADLPNPPDSL